MAHYQLKYALLHMLLVGILFLTTPILAADDASDHPGALEGHSLVYDIANQRAIMYGGTSEEWHENSDTWSYEFATNKWTKHSPGQSPYASMFHEMVYNPDLEQTVITHGRSSIYRSAYVWRFDYATDTWSSVSHNSGPGERSSHSLYYDTANKKTILFGGMVETPSGGVSANDTWEFDALNNRWTKMNPGINPSIRYGHTMVYDTVSETGLLMGGNRLDTLVQNNEIWSYDYSENNWTRLATTNDPPIRYWHSSAYDTTNQQMVIFGGSGGGNRLGDTWILDCNTLEWEEVTGDGPSPRSLGEMVYDPVSNSMLLYGGLAASGVTDEAWLFDLDNKTWELLAKETYEEEAMANYPLMIAGILIGPIIVSRKSRK